MAAPQGENPGEIAGENQGKPGGENRSDAELARLDERLAAQPGDLEALTERARRRAEAGLAMGAFLDRRELLRHRPGDAELARQAAYDLAAAGAPRAALLFVEEHPEALEGEAGAVLRQHLLGDVAARHIRWGWNEPVLDPARRGHEAEAALALLEPMHREDPSHLRTRRDLLLAYRLAERMEDVIGLWEQEIDREAAPYWVRNPAADAYLALQRPAEAEALYRTLGEERPETPQPWLGIYWAAIEQRQFDEAAAALDRLAEIPGQELTAEIQRGWLLLFSERTVAGLEHFERLFAEHPGEPRVRSGLASASLWLGWPRRSLAHSEQVLARTTLDEPWVDDPSARITRAGALAALGDLGAARREAEELATLYPDNQHARRLRRDVDTRLDPELRFDARYETSDRGLGEAWGHLEASVPVGTRARVAAGYRTSISEDDRYTAGEVEAANLGLTVQPRRWLALGAEVEWDLAEPFDRDPGARARLTLLPGDRLRVDLGYSADTWRELPLRARAAGLVADAFDLGVGYQPDAYWETRLAGGRSEVSDGNERTWGLAAASRLVRESPGYRATVGAELYGSENSRSDVPYFSPESDRSATLTHRSTWLLTHEPDRRRSLSLFVHAGVYDQEGFDAGAVGGAWLEADWDFAGRTVLVLGAGARSQLYDGQRELDPRVYLTLRRRF